jgi:alkanesulfonate monooxygenase SsuD/methylene tetrahydromethanopterin reductase-like flavin-dependent oxidoreductase (luciferase family)
VKFSIAHFPRSWDASEDETVIDGVVEHSLLADALGFDGVFFPEHHFHGYSPTGSDAFQMAAYLAPQLKRAWLGMAVVVVPLHNPVHMVEQMNMLDQLTRGKVLFGIGSGIHAEEGLGFGLNFDHQINVMTPENLEVAEQLWDKSLDDPPLTFQTSTYKGTVLERIVPAPYRKRRPLLMGVAARESSIVRAARLGWPVFVSDMQGWGALQKYRQLLAEANHPHEVQAHCMGWTTVTFQGIFVAETDERAFADMLTVMTGHERFNQRQLPFIREAERLGNVSEHAVRVRPPANDERYYSRWCIWGSPDTIAARLQRYADVGIGNLLLSFNNGLYDAERRRITDTSLRLFVDEVMPRFHDLPVPTDPLAIDLDGAVPTATERLAYH